jgi:hypothetical protein
MSDHPFLILVFDSVTKLPPGSGRRGRRSAPAHAAVYRRLQLSAKFGHVRAAIHHDAGIGKDEAGVSGLAYADASSAWRWLPWRQKAPASATAPISYDARRHQPGQSTCHAPAA